MSGSAETTVAAPPGASTVALEAGEVIHVADGEGLMAAAAIMTGRVAWSDAEAAAEAAAVLAGVLPAEVVRKLHRFAAAGSANNVMLLRGLTPSPDLQPSPGSATPAELDCHTRAASLLLLAVLTRLGHAFTFASLYDGRLVQHVTPVPGLEQVQTGEGSDAFLDWHVEDAFSDDRCDLFALYCLRGDPGATTLVAPARQVRLDPRWDRVLREPRFTVEPDGAHGDRTSNDRPPVAVLSGPADDPEICYDAVHARPADPTDLPARQSLEQLGQALTIAAVGQVLAAGDLLIVDNRRVVHARSRFRPRCDGTDRWLLRVMVCSCGRAHRRRSGRRAI